MNEMLAGAIALGNLVVGQFFFRFWRQTDDRFFLFFALSFWIEGASRIALGLVPQASETEPFFYGLRIVSYGLIIVAIWQKNRPPRA